MTHGSDRPIARAFSPQVGGRMQPGALPQARVARAFSPQGLRAVLHIDPAHLSHYHCPGRLPALQHNEAFTWISPIGERGSMSWMSRLWR
jgi:hypothetical protein